MNSNKTWAEKCLNPELLRCHYGSFKAHLPLNVISTEHTFQEQYEHVMNKTLTLNKNLNCQLSSIRNINLRIILSQMLWLILFRKREMHFHELDKFLRKEHDDLLPRGRSLHTSENNYSLHVFILEVWPSEVRTHEKKQAKKKAKTKDTEWKRENPKERGRNLRFTEILSSKVYCLTREVEQTQHCLYFQPQCIFDSSWALRWVRTHLTNKLKKEVWGKDIVSSGWVFTIFSKQDLND